MFVFFFGFILSVKYKKFLNMGDRFCLFLMVGVLLVVISYSVFSGDLVRYGGFFLIILMVMMFKF